MHEFYEIVFSCALFFTAGKSLDGVIGEGDASESTAQAARDDDTQGNQIVYNWTDLEDETVTTAAVGLSQTFVGLEPAGSSQAAIPNPINGDKIGKHSLKRLIKN